jgi:dual specificity tyrosine-phosphorylation-regulated kinase 2/3/4
MLLGLHSLATKQIVHCDLKPENILIKFDSEIKTATEVKIIDFGAAFEFNGSPFLSVTTPEYMPPDFLQLFSHRKNMNNRQKHEQVVKTCHPWSIDVWSLGVIIIEMLVGVPVWMSFKCRSVIGGKELVNIGLFSSTSR